MSRFPGSEIVSKAKNKVLKYSTGAVASGTLQNKNGLENIVLHPSLKRRIEHLARATANTKTHQAPFRNMLFYGPPGTGKTMVAREIARKSVLYQLTASPYLYLITEVHFRSSNRNQVFLYRDWTML